MPENPWILSDSNSLEKYLVMNAVVEPTLKLEIKYDDKILCTISGFKMANSFTIGITNSEDIISQEIAHALIHVGAIPLKFSIHNKSQTAEKITTDDDFSEWIDAVITSKTVFIDTNIMLNKIISSQKKFFNHDLTKDKIEIPRLAILEMENQSNSKKDEKNDTLSYQAYLKKRKALLGFGELMYLIENGGQHMPDLPLETLTAFSKISGSMNTDALIRREIKERSIFLMKNVTKFSIFLTCDMVNALSAVAEGLETIYISKIPDWAKHISPMTSEQISIFITTLAMLFTPLAIEVNSRKSNLKGIWSGITTYEIINKKIMVQAVS
jgi:hypothetical protein